MTKSDVAAPFAIDCVIVTLGDRAPEISSARSIQPLMRCSTSSLASGNSVMLGNLLRLARLTGREDLEERASATAAAFAGEINAHPKAYTAFLCGLDYAFGPSYEVVIVGSRNDRRTKAMFDAVNKRYHRNVVILFKSTESEDPPVTKFAAFTESMKAEGDRATAYVCTEGRCLKPVTTAEDLDRALS